MERTDRGYRFTYHKTYLSLAGFLERTDRGYRFTYHKTYLSLADAEPVSLTLPMREKP